MSRKTVEKVAKTDDKVCEKTSSLWSVLVASLSIILALAAYNNVPTNSISNKPKPEYQINGGWKTRLKDILVNQGPCNIPVLKAEETSVHEFLDK